VKSIVLALTLAVGGSAAGASRPLTPARFATGHGWHTGSTRVHGCVGVPHCKQVESWAATVRWRDCGNCVPPHKTLATLPAAGVTIQLLLGRDAKTKRRPLLAWPPHIRGREVVGPFEGGPAWISSAQRSGVLHGFDASLYVFFGRRHPSWAQLARANAELRTARLP